MWKKIHVELKFLRFEFHHFIYLLLPLLHLVSILLQPDLPPSVCSFFFGAADLKTRFSTQHLFFSNQIVFLYSSKLQIVFLFLCSYLDLQIVFFLCSSLYLALVLWNSSSIWINCSTSAVWTWVFRAWVCHRTWASRTRNASFLNGFKSVLTNKIVSKNYARWQISPHKDTNQ